MYVKQWCCFVSRLRVFPQFSSCRDIRASETRARVKITPREKRRHAGGNFHARSRFARFTIPEGKWGTTRSLFCQQTA